MADLSQPLGWNSGTWEGDRTWGDTEFTKTIAAAAARLLPILPKPAAKPITAATVRDMIRKETK